MGRISLIMLLIAMLAVSASAQDDGQFCVRSYDDRNANQTRDVGEPLLTSGVGADLMDETGIVVASALLADSPTAAQGVICFQFLPAGQYTIQVTSAEYQATTPETMTVTLVGGELPSVLEFGAQSVSAVVVAPAAPEPDPQAAGERVLVAGVGALVALVVMQLIGLIIYLVRFRRRQPVVVETKADTGQFKRPLA